MSIKQSPPISVMSFVDWCRHLRTATPNLQHATDDLREWLQHSSAYIVDLSAGEDMRQQRHPVMIAPEQAVKTPVRLLGVVHPEPPETPFRAQWRLVRAKAWQQVPESMVHDLVSVLSAAHCQESRHRITQEVRDCSTGYDVRLFVWMIP